MTQFRLGPQHKSFPPSSWGATLADFRAEGRRVSEFHTPLLTLDRSALDHNTTRMMAWCRERGLDLAPHGKTTMAPVLWQELTDAGAWAITVATAWQAQVAVSQGVGRVLVANELIDPVGLGWIDAHLRDPEATSQVLCWADSLAAVAAMERTLGAEGPALDVLVELGRSGGRTGARSIEEAELVAAAIARAPRLRLAGVGGYEGALAGDREPGSVAIIRDYCRDLAELATNLDQDGLLATERPVVTAAGSAFFDLVAEELEPLVPNFRVVLRSGAFQVHDDDHYRRLSGFAGTDEPLVAGMHGWARVLSRPEPALALCDAGKRDLPYDVSMPIPLDADGAPRHGWQVTRMNDQHLFLRLPPQAQLAVGEVLRFGLSHPCTAFDKWRLIPVVDDAAAPDPMVIDAIETLF